jgi:transcriptional regulator with XRE-family HTH domain
MATASLRKAEDVDYRAKIGEAVKKAARLAGDWSLKELAAHLKRDERQVARWLSGQERAQLDVLWEVEELRGPLVLALAELSQQAEVVTTISLRRIA